VSNVSFKRDFINTSELQAISRDPQINNDTITTQPLFRRSNQSGKETFQWSNSLIKRQCQAAYLLKSYTLDETLCIIEKLAKHLFPNLQHTFEESNHIWIDQSHISAAPSKGFIIWGLDLQAHTLNFVKNTFLFYKMTIHLIKNRCKV
jgi:hypothetical protein